MHVAWNLNHLGILLICTLRGVGQGLAPPEGHGPPQGQEARDFLGAEVLLARGHPAGEVEGDQC
jgi:hypothetical protein